ncbi:MAG: tautomerase family protein [Deltaproteobacteria bacterium]|nr:tautomerase family protein [Deltaproteobacteria bacterium]
MPFIQVKLIEGVFSEAQKQEMIQKLTESLGENPGPFLLPVY